MLSLGSVTWVFVWRGPDLQHRRLSGWVVQWSLPAVPGIAGFPPLPEHSEENVSDSCAAGQAP